MNASTSGILRSRSPEPDCHRRGQRQRRHTGEERERTSVDPEPLLPAEAMQRARPHSWMDVKESKEENDDDQGVQLIFTDSAANSQHGVENHHVSFNETNQRDVPNGIEDSNDNQEEDLRRKLAFHFLNPVHKYKARNETPWKMILQVIKIFFVTAQVCVFGGYRYNHTKYYTNNQVAFDHLFLKGWDPAREIHAYPAPTGIFAVYDKKHFFDYFDYLAQTFHRLENITVNPVFKNSSLGFCVKNFATGHVKPDLTWDIDFNHLDPQLRCISIPETELANMSSVQYLDRIDFHIHWDTMTYMKFNFTLKTLTFTQLGPLFGPECYEFSTSVTFDNSDFDGQIPIGLDLSPIRIRCPHPIQLSNGTSISIAVLNYLIIFLCAVSLCLCLRALLRAQLLRIEAEEFFLHKYGWTLSSSERLEFLNGWYIIICINDILIIIGSIIKQLIETRNVLGDLWDYCSLFLGIGNLLVWVGLLRYLGFFKTYNALILTMKNAFPSILRFLLCAIIIYLGFVFCGWLVLAPYHFKFSSIFTTSECLFSLINGDDMFATFSSLPKNSSTLISGFAKIYFYIFISLFIYVILSLFIAIIMDSYDIIKDYYKNGFPKSRIHAFYTSASYDPSSGVFRRHGREDGDRTLRRLYRTFSNLGTMNRQGHVGNSTSQMNGVFSSDNAPILS